LDTEAELIKAAWCIKSYRQLLHQYICEIWDKEIIPNKWSESRITPLWKRKGSRLDPCMYRGIALGSILVKIFMNIIIDRMETFYNKNLLKTQFGFRKNKGCNDGIFVMKQLQSIAIQQNRPLYTCFVDLSSAYDHINRKALFQSIKNRINPTGFDNNDNLKCVRILEQLYNYTTAFIKDEDPASKFIVSTGIRQGGNEAQNLFVLYEDYALRIWREKCEKLGLNNLNIDYHIPSAATDRVQRSIAPVSGTLKDSEGAFADDIGIHS